MVLGVITFYLPVSAFDRINRMTSFKRMRKEMGLVRARQAGETVESIQPAMVRLRERFPKAGCREMKNLLFYEENKSVPRQVQLTSGKYCALNLSL
jgi:hypothetical protein